MADKEASEIIEAMLVALTTTLPTAAPLWGLIRAHMKLEREDGEAQACSESRLNSQSSDLLVSGGELSAIIAVMWTLYGVVRKDSALALSNGIAAVSLLALTARARSIVSKCESLDWDDSRRRGNWKRSV